MLAKQFKSTAGSSPCQIKAKWWRACVALITALALVLLLITSATHHHNSELEADECALCCVATDKISNVTPLVLIAAAIAYFLYFSSVITHPATALFTTARLLPPGCGPPAISLRKTS